MKNTLEICLDAPEDLRQAAVSQANRIELCSALDLGGLTPTPGLIAQAKHASVPIYMMIRPRSGNFVYSEAEIQSMEADIQAAREAGFAGVVFGSLTANGDLDINALRRLTNASKGMGMTLHRAVDELASPRDAVKTARDLGFERILTSGGAPTAREGAAEISAMIKTAGNDIEIMAGSGIKPSCVKQLFEVGVRSFHASCRCLSDDVGRKKYSHEAAEELLTAVSSLRRT